MREFTVFAPAKLNLYLDVLDKRPDGYHNIETIFEKIDLRDEIIIREYGPAKELSVEVSPAVCPGGKDNIVYKALTALLKAAKSRSSLGLEIVINKKIPVAAGLGGGSSDAAAALRAVNEKFRLGISQSRLFDIADSLGKDVPFFLEDWTFAKGTGAGEKLESIDSDMTLSHIIMKASEGLSTGEMYGRLDTHTYRRPRVSIKQTIRALQNKDLFLLRESYFNVFEEVLGGHDRVVAGLKKILDDSGAGPGFLSGSGPSVFCILTGREEAMKILQRLPETKGIDIFLAASYKGGIYGDN